MIVVCVSFVCDLIWDSGWYLAEINLEMKREASDIMLYENRKPNHPVKMLQYKNTAGNQSCESSDGVYDLFCDLSFVFVEIKFLRTVHKTHHNKSFIFPFAFSVSFSRWIVICFLFDFSFPNGNEIFSQLIYRYFRILFLNLWRYVTSAMIRNNQQIKNENKQKIIHVLNGRSGAFGMCELKAIGIFIHRMPLTEDEQ